MSSENIDFSGKDINDADQLFEYANNLGFGEIHVKFDKETNLQAIVAIHSTQRGPAFGGCRFIPYTSSAEALIDAMRLARGMTYKASVAGIHHGGGKAVIIRPPKIENYQAYLEAYGRFIEDLGGRYITATDSGTTTADMDIIATQTKYVACTSSEDTIYKGASYPPTAIGVFKGIQAAVKHKLKRDDLEGLHVAIQGVGAVGYLLAQFLHEQGAKLTVTDINKAACQRCAEEFKAKIVNENEIYDIDCDVFAPCALGTSINSETIPRIKAKIIAGAANNQLSQRNDGEILRNKGILFAPDYVINAGGLIYAVEMYKHGSEDAAIDRISHISDSLLEIFERAEKENIATNIAAGKVARERLAE